MPGVRVPQRPLFLGSWFPRLRRNCYRFASVTLHNCSLSSKSPKGYSEGTIIQSLSGHYSSVVGFPDFGETVTGSPLSLFVISLLLCSSQFPQGKLILNREMTRSLSGHSTLLWCDISLKEEVMYTRNSHLSSADRDLFQKMRVQYGKDCRLVSSLGLDQAMDRRYLKNADSDEEAAAIRKRMMKRRRGKDGLRSLNKRIAKYHRWCDKMGVWG